MSNVCTQTEYSPEGPCVTVQGHCVHLHCWVRFSQLRLACCRLLTLSEDGHTVCKIALELLCPAITVPGVGQSCLGLITGLAETLSPMSPKQLC